MHESSEWYHAHFESTGWMEGVDSEQLALELFQELAERGPDGTSRVETLLSACMRMPWNRHLAEVAVDHDFDTSYGQFSVRLDSVKMESLLSSLSGAGLGANPMPFPKPEIDPCRILYRQHVTTARGEHTLDHVLIGDDGRGYGFVRNLQNCIYGKVRHGIELEGIASMQRMESPRRAFGSIFGGGSGLALTTSSNSNHAQQRWRATGVQVAIKCIERPKYEAHVERHRGRLNEDPIKEVAVMQHIRRSGGASFVLKILGCYADEDTVYVVLPFCPHGDLFGLVEENGGLPEQVAVSYFQQIIQGLETLHEVGLSHHDMSLENLMLDDDRCTTVIDFGMAVKTQPTQLSFLNPSRGRPYHRIKDIKCASLQPSVPAISQRARTRASDVLLSLNSLSRDVHHDGSDNAAFTHDQRSQTSTVPVGSRIIDQNYFSVPHKPSRSWPCRCGKLLYMAPELYEPMQSFDLFAVDVWALGIILFLLLTGMPPWDAATGPASTDLRYCYVRDGRLHELLRTWNICLSEHAPSLLQSLLDANPKTRITIPELKEHPWWKLHVPSPAL